MNASLVADWISDIALWAASVSWEAILPAIIVVCLSRLRLIPARWCALLAIVVLARLVIPFSIPVSWRGSLNTHQVATAIESPAVAWETSEPLAIEASFSWMSVLPWVWAVGAASVLAWSLVSYFSIRRITAAGKAADPRLVKLLRQCAAQEGVSPAPTVIIVPSLQTVAIFGWLKPRLLVPHGMFEKHSEAELRGILLHELQHLKRHDALWTWLGLMACAVHWFNPLAWLLFRRFTADRELACDEAALHHLRTEDRRTYGEALIKTAERICIAPPALLPSFSSQPTELKYRMTLIMKPQNRSIALQLASVAFGLGITTFAFTSARADGEKPRATEEGKERSESAEGKKSRDGEGEKEGARDGERKKTGTRDGEGERKGPRDGEEKKTGPRDGEGKEKGERDGDRPKSGSRDGDGEKGAREGMKDGEREGARKSAEGEGKGAREGGEREGARKPAEGEGKSSREGGETMSKSPAPSSRASGQQLVIQVDAAGNVVNSRGDIIPIGQVRNRMSSYAAANPDQSVSLRGDPATPYDKIMKVVDALRDVGLKNVQLESAQK